MRRMGSLFAVLMLLVAGVCPALCFSPSKDDSQKHSCCQEGKNGTTLPCKHSGSGVTAAVATPAMQAAPAAIPELEFHGAPMLPAAVLLPPAPRPLPPQPPKPSVVRRI